MHAAFWQVLTSRDLWFISVPENRAMLRRGALTAPQSANVATISESVDLSNAGTFLGDQPAVKAWFLFPFDDS